MTIPPHPPLSGLLLVDKPYRLSSTSIVAVCKRRLINSGEPKSTKVGHGGTLDPLASGLMVILFGKATKLCDRIMAGRKRYTATIDLSRSSDTDDLEGVLTDVPVASPPTREQIDRVLAERFSGIVMQRPPVHSAVWVDGKRSYDLARAGKAAELKERPVHIHDIHVLDYAWPALTIDVLCGKGTYIRSLARDIGAALSTAGVLTALRRTEVAPFTLAHSYHLDNVPDPLTRAHLLNPTDYLRDEPPQ
jgi:tRNA pseudouridine55 synthase